MTPCYWDTSALLAILFKEPGSNKIHRRAFEEGGIPGYTSFLTFVEIQSAISRRISDGSLDTEALARLRLDEREIEISLVVVWPDEDILDDSRRSVSELGLRPADAVHMASARASVKAEPRIQFACLDGRLNAAAQAVGLDLAW